MEMIGLWGMILFLLLVSSWLFYRNNRLAKNLDAMDDYLLDKDNYYHKQFVSLEKVNEMIAGTREKATSKLEEIEMLVRNGWLTNQDTFKLVVGNLRSFVNHLGWKIEDDALEWKFYKGKKKVAKEVVDKPAKRKYTKRK